MPKATDQKRRAPMVLQRRVLDQNVYEAALDRMRHVYKTFDHVAVSFSGGKDSTAVLHVTLDVARELGKLPLRVIFWDEEAIPYETEDYVRRVAANPDINLEWLCAPVRHRNACSPSTPFWTAWNPDERDIWVRPMPPEATTTLPGLPDPHDQTLTIPDQNGLLFPEELGRCAFVLGIRAAESLIRMQAVSRRTVENYVIHLSRSQCPTLQAPLAKVYPIYDWTTEDVWTAPNLLGWDYNAAYDVMEMAGLSHSAQRCAPPYGEEPMQKLWIFKVCFPDVWEKIGSRVPGASTGARYASIELYSFGQSPPKPADLSWRQHIHKLVGAHGDEARDKVIYQVSRWIKHHSRKTAEPILPWSSHPESGVSWHALLDIAARGDLKERRQLIPGRDPDKQAKMRDAYDNERAELETQLGRTLTFDETGDMT